MSLASHSGEIPAVCFSRGGAGAGHVTAACVGARGTRVQRRVVPRWSVLPRPKVSPIVEYVFRPPLLRGKAARSLDAALFPSLPPKPSPTPPPPLNHCTITSAAAARALPSLRRYEWYLLDSLCSCAVRRRQDSNTVCSGILGINPTYSFFDEATYYIHSKPSSFSP